MEVNIVRKIVGIQKELNELAEALTVNGFDVTNILDTDKELDAIIFYNDKTNLPYQDDMIDSVLDKCSKSVIKINAAKTNFDDILKILKDSNNLT